jgi:dCMP deaminase
MSDRLTWEEYAVALAHAASLRSEDPYVKVGACILRADHSVAALGYNGAPPGVELDWTDRDARRVRVIHAEANALRFVRPGEGVLMATTLMPCVECLKLTRAHGIDHVVFAEYLPPHYDSDTVRSVAREFGVTLHYLPPRKETHAEE